MSHQGPLKGPHRRAPKHSPYAGSTTCLRCDHEFSSWDRRQNRLCPRCNNKVDDPVGEESSVGGEVKAVDTETEARRSSFEQVPEL